MKLRTAVGLAALSAALWGVASAASAQTYSRMVVFGDSLSDNGNIPVIGGGNNPPPPYYANHFSNGPTYAEDVAGALGLGALGHFGQTSGSVDWAVGGAETGTGNYGNAALPGMATEIGAYLGPYHGTVGSHDLVVLWGGANDVFANLPAAGASSNPTGYISNVAAGAANQIATYAGQFATAGAGTVLVPNLPPLAQTPQFSSGPGAVAAPLALTAANTFNATLLAGLQADAGAHPNTNFILIDTNTMLQVVLAKPSAFGFANSTSACISTPACVTGSTATQNTYVFWDGVHPTASSHALLAGVMLDYLMYGDRGAVRGVQTETTLRNRSSAQDAAIGRMQARDFSNERSGVGVSLDYDDAQVDARPLVASTKDTTEALRINVQGVASPTLKFGAQVSFSEATINAGAMRFHDQTVAFDGSLALRGQRLFLNVDAGVGLDDLRDIKRQTALPGMVNTASTSGWSAGVKAQAGTWFDLGNRWTLSPRAAIAFNHGVADGYTEHGPFDRYQYLNNSINSSTIEGTLRLSGPIGAGAWAHLEGGYRDEISYNARPVRVTLADNVAQVLERSLADPEGGVGLIDAGLGGVLCKDLKWDVGYRGRFGSKFNDNQARLGLNLSF